MSRRWHELASGRRRGVRAALGRCVLAALAVPYAMAIRGRNHLFDAGWRRVHRLPRPVVSVGNLTAGGTGKTPFTLELARRLEARGLPPAILTRGYRRERGGEADEAKWLEAVLGPGRVFTGTDRCAAGRRALAARPELGVLLLDDGFQHRRLHRDLDLVLIDTAAPFGFDHLLPRGLLREPPAGLARADLVILTRVDRIPEPTRAAIHERLNTHAPRVPRVEVTFPWHHLAEGDNQRHPLQLLDGAPVLAAAGIGNPEAFLAELAEHGADVREPVIRADHHPWRRPELAELFRLARAAGARAVVSTGKDWVKWAPHLAADPGMAGGIPIWRPEQGVRVRAGEAVLENALDQALAH